MTAKWRNAAALPSILLAALAALAVLPAPALGHDTPARAAAEGRPDDAPRVEPKGAAVPPLPPEYLTQEAGWLRVAYHPSARERVRPLIAQADAIRDELRAELGADVLSSVEVRVAAVPGEMARLSPAELPGYATGVAFGELHLIVMSLASPLSLEPPKPSEVLRHGLAHIALDQALAGGPVPRWFHEGYAVKFAADDGSLRAQTLFFASLRGRLLNLSELESKMPADAPQSSVAYAQAADFLRFLTRSESKSHFAALVRRVREGDDFQKALASAYAMAPAELELAWRKDIAMRYGFLPGLLCGTLVWVAALVIVAVKRARRSSPARRPLLVRHTRRVEVEARPRPVLIPPARGLPPSRARATLADGGDIRDEAMPPDPDVPKVEHEGEWHTLH
jgi:hypothetical protein